MKTLHNIQNAVEKLSRDGLERFRAWFEEFDTRLWDAEIERDVRAAKLDALALQALAEHEKEVTLANQTT